MNHHAAAILHFAYSITACTTLRVCRRALASTAAALPEAKDLARQTETRISLPDATWTCGVQQPAPFKRQMWKQFDPDSAEKFSRYSLLISCAVPRPIALVTSLDTNGVRNCAPFSYFGVVSHDPPLLSVTVCTQGRDRTQKDTLNNIIATNQFVVNIMSEWFVESANHTCGAFPPDVDEITVSGLSAVPSVKVKPPRVAESAVQLECQVSTFSPSRSAGYNSALTIMCLHQ